MQVAADADAPVAKHILATLCGHCGCSLAPTTVSAVTVSPLSSQQAQRAWRRARGQSRNPADWTRNFAVHYTCMLCSRPTVTLLAHEQDAHKVRSLHTGLSAGQQGRSRSLH